MVILAWFGLVGPAGMPADVVATLNAPFNKALATDLVQNRFRELSLNPEGGPPERFQAFIDGELARWERVVKTRNISVE